MLHNKIRVTVTKDALYSQLLSLMKAMEETFILCYIVCGVEVDSEDIAKLVTLRQL